LAPLSWYIFPDWSVSVKLPLEPFKQPWIEVCADVEPVWLDEVFAFWSGLVLGFCVVGVWLLGFVLWSGAVAVGLALGVVALPDVLDCANATAADSSRTAVNNEIFRMDFLRIFLSLGCAVHEVARTRV